MASWTASAPDIGGCGWARRTFPLEEPSLIGPLVELLAHRGRLREVLLLVNGEPSVEAPEYDNYDGGVYFWKFTLRLPVSAYAQVNPQTRREMEESIAENIREIVAGLPTSEDRIGRVEIQPLLQPNPNWREHGLQWLQGDGINNQGRVRSDNIAAREFEGLRFRSRNEENMFRAFKTLGVTIAPLPVFLRGATGQQRGQRIEPDFIILRGGSFMVLEVDGDLYHQESPAEADERMRIFSLESAFIRRVRADDCNEAERAAMEARAAIADFDRWRAARK